jgi:chemotaxis protein methyltransferase CheR
MSLQPLPSFDSAGAYARFCEILQRRSGIVLGEGKQYLVSSRLTPILRQYQLASLQQLVEKLDGALTGTLLDQVIDAMTTNETMWFRDNYPFDVLKSKLFPEFGGLTPINIWCAACSTGQEPYSVVMTAEEYRQENRLKPFPGVRIIATDIASSVLKAAKEGVYEQLAVVRGLSDARKRQFFDPLPDQRWQIKPLLRQSVSFQSLNLLNTPYGVGPFDIIFCRNVLIYFSPTVKSNVLNHLANRLKKGGYLFVGGSESLGDVASRFEMIRCAPGIVYQLKS